MATDTRNERFTKVYLTLWGICIFVAFVAFVFYKFGFRLTSRFEPVKVGVIELTSNQSGLQVFLDNREQRTSLLDGRYLIRNVTPGLHSILVSKEDFWPWAKTVTVTQNTTRQLYVFMFPMNGLETKDVSPKTSEYSIVRNTFKTLRLPELAAGSPRLLPDDSIKEWIEKNVPDVRMSSDKSTALYVKNNTVYVAWISDTEAPSHYFCEENPCKFIMPVTVSSQPLKSVDFYKDRRDLVLFSAGSALYAIEVGREGTQNFQPVFKATDPYFYQTPTGTLYIKDGDSILSTSL